MAMYDINERTIFIAINIQIRLWTSFLFISSLKNKY
jgi:hypothetical protein